MSIPIIQLHNVSLHRDDLSLLSSVSFKLLPGQCLHLVGGNGIGKTSLLRAVAGFYPVASGTLVNRCQQSLLLGHEIAIDPQLTVYEQLLLDPALSLTASDIMQALRLFDLHDVSEVECARLSRGMSQRLALTRVACASADLLLLDEPLTACDADAQQRFEAILCRKLEAGVAVIFTSHNSEHFSKLSPKRLPLSAWQPELGVSYV